STMSPVVISLTCLGRPMQCRLPPAGGQDKPSLSAWPSPVVPQGQHVTLQCRSHHKFDTFRMYKDNGILVSKLHSVMSQKGFLIGPVTPTQAGTYRCCGPCPGSSSWSAPSDPLDIMITGLHQKPSLWAQPGAVVRSGENVTFSCCSESSFDVYQLSRDEQPHECWLAKGQRRGGESQADFPLGPAHSALGGTYRCHGSFNRSPCEWSGPSDPLYISITDVAIMNREPEVDRMVSREDPQAEDPQEVIDTQSDHCISTWKKTTPTFQRPEESLRDDSVYVELSYLPLQGTLWGRTHTMSQLSTDDCPQGSITEIR
uniref:Killer cell immunoglobulin-like receptor 3DL3 n=1 Tax=Ailuropoda melanoleuca TaxID=9646 RepID=A0A7N5KJV0_AILME